ncbi:MAG: redoxin domain-containing protein [Alphaproteobacteria bacterium]|nr:redoxin domain-containing protein [Alphaproteobacteria bacterium]
MIIGGLVGLLASGFGKNPNAIPSTLEGSPAPAFALQSFEGEEVSLAALRGKPVMLNFWASWCVPCAQEHQILVEASKAYGRDVIFLGVLYSDTQENGEGFLAKRGHGFPTLLDPDGRTAVDYGVTGVPETFFIDRQGRIARKVTGPLSGPVLVTALEEVL